MKMVLKLVVLHMPDCLFYEEKEGETHTRIHEKFYGELTSNIFLQFKWQKISLWFLRYKLKFMCLPVINILKFTVILH